MATPSDANHFVPELDPEGAALTPEEARNKEDNDAKRLAERCRLKFIDLTSFQPDQELFQSVPVDLMFRYNFLPYRKEDGKLVVVTADPTNVPAMDEIASILNMPVRAAVGTDSAIQELLKKSQSAQRVLEEASESFHMEIIREDEEGEETLSMDRLADTSSPIIRLIDSAIYNALNRRASDIHIETRDEEVVIKYRIDGALTRAMKPIPKAHHSEIISRIKVMAELDIAEKRVPQDGRFRLKIKGRRIDFRVSIMPSIHGEDAVIRILDKESISERFTELRLDILGMAESEVKSIRRFIHEPYGMFLVTGPTGSGKTTTLYAALSEIYNEEDKIITIEDPVEYQLEGITQIPINEKKGLTFSRGLRSILRHDPDKIMVGEIRDSETALIAINAALTGHLVFTTVHANNVIDVIGRFLNMGVEPYNFVSSLNCILAQRLIRAICTFCKKPFRADAALLQDSALDPLRYGKHTFYRGEGCIQCSGSGYKGRQAISELLGLSDEMREMLIERRPAVEIKKAAKESGMVFLRESAVDKALSGLTTLEEINRVTFVAS
ncbi:MAG: type II/IV secretion system protein [Acidobacteria bacterium]|nr:MAG: type II/IV secretion system protein [Acidobacteriota bacterium]